MHDGKFTVYDRGLHVPFIVRWPGKIKTGRTDALINFVDFVPTIIELAGGRVPEKLDGKSLLPIFEKKITNIIIMFMVLVIGRELLVVI